MVITITITFKLRKTQYVHFIPKGTVLQEASIGYNKDFIIKYANTKFLGVIIENTSS